MFLKAILYSINNHFLFIIVTAAEVCSATPSKGIFVKFFACLTLKEEL